jgi:hypothetical protein
MIQYENPWELLPLVDTNDRTRRITRRCKIDTKPDTLFLRHADAFIVNSSAELWIPTRQASREIDPGAIDYSVSEFVKLGESYGRAAVRGFKEELNKNIKRSDLIELAMFEPTLDLGYFSRLYMHISDDDPDFNRSDYTGGEWMSLDNLYAKIKNLEKERIKRGFAKTVGYLAIDPAVITQYL